jgi:3',5'-nucleoside bisphosphate phosphatase
MSASHVSATGAAHAMPVDLHVHTTASDGALSPTEVVRAALAAGLSALAITDHDTMDGLDEAMHAADSTGLEIVPGLELSVDEGGQTDVHVLGLLVDPHDGPLNGALSDLREERDTRARAMVRKLSAAGYRIDYDAIRAAVGASAIGRVHIARALVATHAVPTIDEPFRRLIGSDAPFYIAKQTMTGAAAIAAIHAAGGVAVLAHPGVSGGAALEGLIESGLDGIEAYHAEHTRADRKRFAALAARHGLLVTGGSDFHGPGVRSSGIGGGACPADAVESLRARAALYRR